MVGASVSSGVRLIYNEKRSVQFTLETNLDYVYKTYAIDWSSAYVNINGQGNFDAAYKIKQHELGLSALPGVLFKNLNFNAGLRVKFVVTATEAGRFYKDATAFYTRLKTGAGNTSPIALLSMPLYLAYSIPVSKKTALGFFVQYELGLCDFNDFEREWLPNPSVGTPAVFHIGTLAPLVEPGASVLYEWAQEINQFAPIVFDPNVRPSIMHDRAHYDAIVNKWAAISNVVKVSEDDIAWLYPGRLQEEVAAEWLSMGVDLVVITLGSEGLRGITRRGSVSVPGVQTSVVDTVGAGDTVGAILVEGVVKYGVTGLVGDTLKAVLTRAAEAAAITCSRAGAQPPYLNELSN